MESGDKTPIVCPGPEISCAAVVSSSGSRRAEGLPRGRVARSAAGPQAVSGIGSGDRLSVGGEWGRRRWSPRCKVAGFGARESGFSLRTKDSRNPEELFHLSLSNECPMLAVIICFSSKSSGDDGGMNRQSFCCRLYLVSKVKGG